ncbi:type II toxin-antitoxin system Phd/YefM family antitoxin [Chlorobium sp. N1]|uniref:type II toxin-antitoxin system Phd/YefM family antitoxin n=1 Tax=Chlorobium sp. N1 TaxID=2491138 RepID=UPI00103BF414|nr:type II toxin-antitoxin system Phd/YefM family antitoxin [Chlorobium sp. N1]TCD47145.1 type II toxin-antitoxin system Phd/YefM family antitoxin [Chlorobium sp. N1]
MERINLEEDIRPLSEFRAHAASFVDHVKETRRPLVLTQHGKSAVVLLDVREYQSLLALASGRAGSGGAGESCSA